MKKFILILLLLMLVVIPASAKIEITAQPIGMIARDLGTSVNLQYDASLEGYGIQRMQVDAPSGSVVAFTLWYGNGSTVTGQYSFLDLGYGYARSTIDLGGVTNTYDYFAGSTAIGRVYIHGYAKNVSDTDGKEIDRGLIIGGSTGAITTWQNDYVYYPTSSNSDGVVYKVSIVSNNPVGVKAFVKTRSSVASDISKSWLDLATEWVNFAITMAESVLGFATGVFNAIIWLMAHWMLIAGLYITLTLAVAVNSSKDVFSALKKWFGYQRSLYTFILGIWQALIDIIAQFRGIFRL